MYICPNTSVRFPFQVSFHHCSLLISRFGMVYQAYLRLQDQESVYHTTQLTNNQLANYLVSRPVTCPPRPHRACCIVLKEGEVAGSI